VHATVIFDQREGGVLEWSMLGFGGVSNEFELVRQRYDDDCMHDALFGFSDNFILFLAVATQG
jgi:hypothetical protein